MNKTLYACLTKDPLHYEIVKKHKGTQSDLHVLRSAFQKNTVWPNDSTINIAFSKNKIKVPGDDGLHDPQYTKDKADWVKYVINKYYVPIENLKIKWVDDIKNSDVRISFIPEFGSFSLLGTQCRYAGKDTITMNLGWLDQYSYNTDNTELIGTGVVVVHEFGHMFGMIHEHQREDEPMIWDKEAVYEALGSPPNKWSRDKVDQQIFKQYKMNTLNASQYDPHSVMEYIFPNNFFKKPPNLTNTKYLSNLDIIWLQRMYPGKPLLPNINKDGSGKNPFGGSSGGGSSGGGSGDGSGDDSSGDGSGDDSSGDGLDMLKKFLKNNWRWILILILSLSILFVVTKQIIFLVINILIMVSGVIVYQNISKDKLVYKKKTV